MVYDKNLEYGIDQWGIGSDESFLLGAVVYQGLDETIAACYFTRFGIDQVHFPSIS